MEGEEDEYEEYDDEIIFQFVTGCITKEMVDR